MQFSGLLEKKGWVEGKGLGKKEDGINKALKVKLKSGTNGLGYLLSDEHTFHWWEHNFNSAANSISIKTNESSIVLAKHSIERDKVQRERTKKLLYSNFVRGGVYSSGGTPDQVASEKIPASPKIDISDNFSFMSDEKLFEACGGLTAHKGARHGLHMNGKLRRVEEQDKLLEKRNLDSCIFASDIYGDECNDFVKKKKRKKKHRKIENVSSTVVETKGNVIVDQVEEDSFKKVEDDVRVRRKRKNLDKLLLCEDLLVDKSALFNSPKVKKKNKKEISENVSDHENELLSDSDRNKECDNVSFNVDGTGFEDKAHKKKKKKKKSSRHLD